MSGSHTLIGLVLAVAILAPLELVSGAGDPEKELTALREEYESERGNKDRFLQFRPRFEALARSNAGTEVGLEAELWILRNLFWLRDSGDLHQQSEPLARRLVREHPHSELLGRIAEFSYLFSDEAYRELLERITEVSPHDSVLAACLYQQARGLLRSGKGDGRGEARELLGRLEREYADVPFRYITYGKIANAHLHPHPKSTLQVGETAPDIVGSDVDGNPMRLSDFRGKVVVLDFWGDW